MIKSMIKRSLKVLRIKKEGLTMQNRESGKSSLRVSVPGSGSVRRRLFLILTAGILAVRLCGSASAQEKSLQEKSLQEKSLQEKSLPGKRLIVRLAKIQIDPAQLKSYKAALKEEIETSVRLEPGVLSLSAVSEKEHPTHVTILEVYANTAAYEAHLKTPNFRRYKAYTTGMVKSLELVEADPIVLAAKGK
jgi:4-carboxymuconolactone decarboxylase